MCVVSTCAARGAPYPSKLRTHSTQNTFSIPRMTPPTDLELDEHGPLVVVVDGALPEEPLGEVRLVVRLEHVLVLFLLLGFGHVGSIWLGGGPPFLGSRTVTIHMCPFDPMTNLQVLEDDDELAQLRVCLRLAHALQPAVVW